MFSIQRIAIPAARKASKGKAVEPLSIYTVHLACGRIHSLDGRGRQRARVRDLREDTGPLEHPGRSGRWWLSLACHGIDIELPFKEDKVHKVFIDPTGNHVIITTVAGDCYYLHSSKSKVVVLKRFSEYHIESVAWNRLEGNPTCTGVWTRAWRHP